MSLLHDFSQMHVLKGATKTALAFCVCMSVPLLLDWEEVIWCIWPAIFLTTPFLGYSIEKGVCRVIGTLFAAFVALTFLDWFAQNWVLLTLVLATYFCVMAYFASGDRYPYAFTVGAFTVAIIVVPSLLEPEKALHLAIYRSQNTITGCILALAIFAGVWPRRAGDVFKELVESITQGAATMLGQARVAIETHTRIDKSYLDIRQSMIDKLSEIRTLILYAVRDTGPVRRYRSLYEQLGLALRNLLMNCTNIANAISLHEAPELPSDLREKTLVFIKATEDEIADLGASLSPPDHSRKDNYQGIVDVVREAWVRYISSCGTFKYSPSEAAALGGLMDSVIQLASAMQQAWDSAEALQKQKKGWQVFPILSSADNAKLDLPTYSNSYHLRKGLQAGAAVIAGMAFYYFTDPPGGAAVFELAAVFGVLMAGMPILSLSATLCGLLLGAVIGSALLYGIFIHVEVSLWWLILAMFPASFVGGLFINIPRIAMVGMMCNLMMAAIVITGTQPSYNPVEWYNTIFGQILAAMIAVACARLVWPFMPRVEYSRAIKEYCERCAYLLKFWTEHHPSKPGYQPLLIQADKELSNSLSEAWRWQGLVNWKRTRGVGEQQSRDLLMILEGFSLRYRALEHARSRLTSVRAFDDILPVLLEIRNSMSKEFLRLSDLISTSKSHHPAIDLEKCLLEIDHSMMKMRDLYKQHQREFSAEERHHYLSIIDRYRECIDVIIFFRRKLEGIDIKRISQPSFT